MATGGGVNMTTLSFWTGIFITVAVTLLTIEGSEAFAWCAVKLIHRAAQRMPSSELRERYDEEWLAELAAYDGLKIVKFLKAVSIWWHGRQLEQALEGAPVGYLRYAVSIKASMGLISSEFAYSLVESTPDKTFRQAAYATAVGAYMFPGLLMGAEFVQISDKKFGIYIPYRGLLLVIHKYPIRWTIVVFHDILLVRGGISLREVSSAHRSALRGLRHAWTEPPISES
jgi:hypothetical protein